MKIKTFFKKFKNFIIKIDTKTKIDFVKAFIYTGIWRAYILFVPFNRLKNKMGKSKLESPKEVDEEIVKLAKKISWIVTTIAKYTPWESKCLVQALTAQKMLKENGISTTIYLGVKKDMNSNMLAHAWIRCGEYYVTGGNSRESYAVVAKFSN